MSRLIRDLQLVDARGRKYLTADERQRFLEAARLAPRPTDQTFAITLAHTGARVSEALAVRPMDIDLEVASIRIGPGSAAPSTGARSPSLPSCSAPLSSFTRSARRRRGPPASPRWPWSRPTAHRKIAKTMADAGVEDPQACPQGLRHGFGIVAVAAADDRGLPHRRASRGVGFSGANVGPGAEFSRIRRPKASGEGP